ncbi:hypothetical protein EK904_010171 [Melospiza melodia maxima]|nr:hypothetical protein EK904_010171 [Melospiza melodia maxima]
MHSPLKEEECTMVAIQNSSTAKLCWFRSPGCSAQATCATAAAVTSIHNSAGGVTEQECDPGEASQILLLIPAPKIEIYH